MIFLDTYSIVRIAEDPDYLDGCDDEIVTLPTNLAELHHVLLREYSEQMATHFTKKFSQATVGIPFEIIIPAINWRLDNLEKGFSYADALGYHYALDNDLRFITGDRAFEGMKNVEIHR